MSKSQAFQTQVHTQNQQRHRYFAELATTFSEKAHIDSQEKRLQRFFRHQGPDFAVIA